MKSPVLLALLVGFTQEDWSRSIVSSAAELEELGTLVAGERQKAMNPSLQSLSASDLRTQIRQIRRQLDVAAQSYRAAKRDGNSGRVMELLRLKSALTRQLFETQSALLLLFRYHEKSEETVPSPAAVLVQGSA